MNEPAEVRIALSGATGKTGNAVAHALSDEMGVQLVACVAPSAVDEPRRPLPAGVERAPAVSAVESQFDVLVDFTRAEPAVQNVQAALERGAHTVLGTTGVEDALLQELGRAFEHKGRGLLFAPNFAIGAVLLMKYAQDAARLMPSVEIVEVHNPDKVDAPSGTARRTAQLVAQARSQPELERGEHRRRNAALGERVDGVPVHSIRIEGAVAHQEVVFGGSGQKLTLRHDAFDRSCYAPGVALAARRVGSLPGLTIGLENVL